MSEQIEVLKTVARRLDEAAIPYMVSGSVAMNFYAQPRMTRDIDIVVELETKDSRRLHKLFAEDFFIDEQDVQESIRRRSLFNIIHNAWVIKVDFIVRKETEYRKKEFERRRPISLEGAAIMVVAPEDLILSKLDWAKDSHSEFQLRDARNLVASVENLDWDYIGAWAARLGVADLLEEVRKP